MRAVVSIGPFAVTPVSAARGHVRRLFVPQPVT